MSDAGTHLHDDAAGVALAAFGYLNPVLADLIHVTSELVFILNSARLLSSAGGLRRCLLQPEAAAGGNILRETELTRPDAADSASYSTVASARNNVARGFALPLHEPAHRDKIWQADAASPQPTKAARENAIVQLEEAVDATGCEQWPARRNSVPARRD